VEAFCVLQPGGRIAFTVWATPDKAVGFAMVLKAIEAHGTTEVPLPPTVLPVQRLGGLEAGFVQPDVRDVDQPLVLRAPETAFHALMRGGIRVAAILNAQTPSALELIERAVARDAETYRNDAGELQIPMPCVLASALRLRKQCPSPGRSREVRVSQSERAWLAQLICKYLQLSAFARWLRDGGQCQLVEP
jgi:hypothetical protein